MDIQMILFNEEQKKKIVKVKLENLPPNDELLSQSPSQEFVQDILTRGLLEPIHLNKTDKGFTVISGRRRIKAFRQLQEVEPERFSAIDAIIFEVDDIKAIFAASASNNKRADNPITDLEAIQLALKLKPNATVTEISQVTGIPGPRITKRLKLLNLQPAIQEALKDGRTTVAAAEKAASLPDNLQVKLVENMSKNKGKLSLDQVIDIQRVRVQDTAKNLVLPTFDIPPSTQKDIIFGYVLIDTEFNNILGGIMQDMNEVNNNLNQYKKDYPDLKIEIFKVMK